MNNFINPRKNTHNSLLRYQKQQKHIQFNQASKNTNIEQGQYNLYDERTRMSEEWMEMLKKAKVQKSSTQYKYRFKPKKTNHKILKYDEIVSANGETQPLLRVMDNYQKNNIFEASKTDFLRSKEKSQTSYNAYIANLSNRLEQENKEQEKNYRKNFCNTSASDMTFSKNQECKKISHFPILNYQQYRQQQIYNAYFSSVKERTHSKNLQYMKMKQTKLKQGASEEKKKNLGKMIIQEGKNDDLVKTGSSEVEVEKLHKNLIIGSGPIVKLKVKTPCTNIKPVQQNRSTCSTTDKKLISPLLQNLFYFPQNALKKQKFIELKDDGPSIATKISKCISFKTQNISNNFKTKNIDNCDPQQEPISIKMKKMKQNRNNISEQVKQAQNSNKKSIQNMENQQNGIN